jgi:toxin YoeB
MSYQIVLKKSAQNHIIAHKHSGNVVLCRKIENLLLELVEHPREGTGKPEMLRNSVKTTASN